MKNIFGGENMKVKKVFAAVCTATLAAVALTACGKKDNSASGDQALTWMKKLNFKLWLFLKLQMKPVLIN